MKLLDFIVCDDVRQEIGGKVTVVGVYGDGLNVHIPPGDIAGKPVIKLALLARVLFEKSEEKPDSFYIDFNLNGKSITHVSGQLSVQAPEISFLNIISILNQFAIPESGKLTFRIQFKLKEKIISDIVPDYFLNILIQKGA